VTYLLDTNVLSETRRRQPAAGVASWIAATPPDRLYVSVLTLGEIEQGIARVRGRGDRSQASALENWLHDVETGFEDRILPVTLRVAAAWGRQQQAQPLPVIDALIAATAQVHSLTVVTRNVKDFEQAEVQILNPFAE
jgi:predicted nucleic acid-binding protein